MTGRILRLGRVRMLWLAGGVLTICGLFFWDGPLLRQGIQDGLATCGSVIIPALFPFMVLTMFINQSGLAAAFGRVLAPITRFLFGLPGAAAATLCMAFVGGYPVGTAGVSALYKNRLITKNQAVRMLFFCVGAGPAFILSAVGGIWFGSHQAGLLLLGAHLAGGLTLGVASGVYGHIKGEVAPPPPIDGAPAGGASKEKRPKLSDCFVSATSAAAKTLFVLCGFVVLFSGLSALLADLPLPETMRPLATGLLEVTGGCAAAAGQSSLPLAAFLLGFGGLSVLCQLMTAAKEITPPMAPLLAGRLLHGLISFAVVKGVLCFRPDTIAALSGGASPITKTGSGHFAYAVPWPASLALIFLSLVLIGSIRHTNINPGGSRPRT